VSFTGVTGLSTPDSVPGFLGLLQTAVWRSVPFQVIGAQVKKGRRWAVHEYPFRDGGMPEDMGRAMRTYSFVGYLIGDLAPAMQLAIDTVSEMPGPGLLIHPTIGAVQVALLSCGTAVSRDRGRVISIAFEFLEYGSPGLTAYIATAIQVASLVAGALSGANSDLTTTAGGAAASGGPAAVSEGVAVVSSFCDHVASGGTDPAGIVAMAAGLPPPDANHTFGRYAYGALTTPLPLGTTVQTLQASLATQRTAIGTATTAAIAAADTFSSASDITDPIAATVEAMRAGITDPSQQIRVLLTLSSFAYVDGAGGAGIENDIATVRDAMSAACRRAALTSLALASAAYQPSSYNDAANIRTLVVAALDTEITAAGDAGEDGTYIAFKALRSAVILDLTTRGARLPSVVTVNLPLPLPSLVVAQRLYQDATRSDQIAAETAVPHPAFCPSTIQVLAS
jgi:prophage DNA circulation protein